jgi:hypothetical protein
MADERRIGQEFLYIESKNDQREIGQEFLYVESKNDLREIAQVFLYVEVIVSTASRIYGPAIQ